jgi:hypothetical protein
MPVTQAVADHYTIQYQTNWEMACQQMDSRLDTKARVVEARGSSNRFNVFGTMNMAAVSARLATTPQTDVNMPVRIAINSPYDVSTLFDEFDDILLNQIVLPTSDCMRAQAAGYGRLLDSTLINALLGTATIVTPNSGGFPPGGGSGTTGTQAITNVIANGGTGMTIQKLVQAKQILDANEAPSEGRIFILGSAQLADLLQTTEYTNTLYSQVQALVHGDAHTFLGFEMIRSELLPLDVATGKIRRCLAYQRDSAAIATGEKKSFMDIRADISHALQVRSTAVVGATRLQEAGVVEVDCVDAL